MLDENTIQLLEELSQQDLFKVTKMIEKLANKRGAKPKKEKEPEDFVHQIQKDSHPVSPQHTEESNGSRINLFESMDAMHEHKEDTEIDKMLNVSPPTKRNRTPNLVEVPCALCGRVDKVSAVLVTDSGRYTCNGCQTRGGR